MATIPLFRSSFQDIFSLLDLAIATTSQVQPGRSVVGLCRMIPTAIETKSHLPTYCLSPGNFKKERHNLQTRWKSVSDVTFIIHAT